MDAYVVRFNVCKDKVTQACLQLDLSNILIVEAVLEEEEEGAAKKEATGTEESTIKRPKY